MAVKPPSSLREALSGAAPLAARDPVGSVAPVSFVQQRLWLFEQLEPGSRVYQRSSRLRLRGPLRPDALERTLSEVVRRHESLRTVFAERDGMPLQIVRPCEPQQLPIEDLRGLPVSQRETRLEEREEEASRPFDLSCGPLFRAQLFRLAEEEHVLLWNVHHLVFDAWSTTILRRELEVLYAAFEAGEPSPLADPMAYSDYARRQREPLREEPFSEQLAYWKTALSGAPDLLDLPFDRPRPLRQRYRGATEDFAFGPGTTDGLGRLARETGATQFMSVLAAFQVLLSRYSGRDDFLVGVPIAGRRKIDTEDVIGCFINTLVLRADLSGRPGFREVLARVRAAALGAFERQDVPFEKVVEALQPLRRLNRAPLFQVMLNFRNVPQPRDNGGPLAVELEERPPRVAMVDLTLELSRRAGGLGAQFIYDRDLFDAPTIRRMAEHLRVLVASGLEDPGRPVSGLPLLTERERNGMLAAWSRPRRPLPPRATVRDLIARQMLRRPGSIALEGEGKTLTYAELEGRVERLADRLRQAGLGPERVAALFGRRSLDTIVGMLAIIESDGAFLPLDPSLPRHRLDFLIGDARPELVAAPMALAAHFYKHGLAFVPIEDEAGGASPAGRLDRAPGDADRLAYVIYTSGSTGQAKGVEVSHRSLLNLTRWARKAFGLRPEDRVLQLAPLHFDTAIEEIFPALAAGATLVLRPDSAIETPAAFLDWCRIARLTVLDLPTAYWHEVAAALARGETELPRDVRLVVIGGESALPARLDQWRRTVGSRVRLLNTYGPTEATVTATMSDLTQRDERSQPEQRAVSIGRPIRNVRAYVLDGGQEPVPIGVAGELYLAGAGIARGYRNDREATAKSFTADPFDQAPGARRYRTGDRARYLPDGTLEFLGRLDRQVKIRGFRVEPIEVEASLVKHPGLTEAAVIASDDAPGDRRLIAYWVAGPGNAPSARQLQKFLSERLPDYMIPRSFVRLERLPRASTGKVDRRALELSGTSTDRIDRLRLPEVETTSAVPTELAPRTPVEKTLAGIWKEILRVDRVGFRDDFFDLGGHSLHATQLVSRVAEEFGLRIPIRRVFEEPILERLALAITQGLAEAEEGTEMLRVLGEVRGSSDGEAGGRKVSEAEPSPDSRRQ